MGRFFDELKRRNVVRVGVAYVVLAWLVAQVAETLFPAFGTPDWVFRTLVVLIALGFPFALLFAWAFELTPQGIRKTRDVDLSASLTHSTGRRLDFVIIGALAIALGYFLWERQGLIEASREAESAVAGAEQSGDDKSAPAADADTPRSIAVLPFVNLSPDRSQEWFADGLTEELLNSLVRIPDLLVASRTSSFAYKGTDKPLPAIAGELGVDHVLEGSVRRAGDRLRVTAQLIRAEDGFHLWSETYDRTLDDVIEIQEEVAVEIARAMETALDPDALAAMMSAGTLSVPAYEAYLEGLAHGVSMQVEGDVYAAHGGREAFERAVEIDPDFAKAWNELGIFWSIQLDTTLIVSGITDLSEEEMLVEQARVFDRAIEVEKDPVNVLLYRARKALPTTNFALTRRLLDEYLEHRPNDVEAHITQLLTLADLRRYDDVLTHALEVLERGAQEPIISSLSLQALRYDKDHERQRSIVQQALAEHPGNVNITYQAHRTLLYAGDIDGASRLVPIIRRSVLPQASKFLVELRQTCAEQRVADARQLVDRYRATREVSEQAARVTDWLAHHILGESDAARALLAPLDNPQGAGELVDYMAYGHFNARDFPYLLSQIEGKGVQIDDLYEMPYRCRG